MVRKPLPGLWATCVFILVAAPGFSATTGSTPYYGSAATVPGTIQAEDFDNGGQNVAYNDSSSGNTGGAYRQTDVDIETSTEGGYDVGWIAPGEWLNYSVNVGAAGTYLFEARVANAYQGGTFHLEAAGLNVSGPLTIPNTGAWQHWTTVSAQVALNAGTQVLRVVFDTNGATSVGNFNWFRLTAQSTTYSGAATAIPGTIRAENFDNGGQNVAYSDTTAGNSGGAYRQTDVDIESSSAGGYDIGWTADGEWLAYTVNVASAGTYSIQVQVASPYSSGRLHASFNGANTSIVAVPNTGGWQAWTTVTTTATLAAGPQQMRLAIDTGGFNIGAITVTGAQSTPYNGTPTTVPGTLRPENFDDGGQGVAYFDTTAGNSGGQYRNTDVDIETASNGGYDIGWTADGEWLAYTINAAAAGTYTFTAQVASPNSTGQFHVSANGVSTPAVAVPNTGGWQNWTTISFTAPLAAGQQVLRVVFDTGGFNLNAITIAAPQSTAYGGTPAAVPGTLHAENFDNGGPNVAYYDTTAGNSGGAYRSTDVDIEASSAGGYDVGWVADGEWLKYTVNAAAAGNYTVTFHVASPNATGQLHAVVNGVATPIAAVPNTGGWQNWTTVSVPATFAAGTQVMQIVVDTGGFNVAAVDVAAAVASASGSGGSGSGGSSGGKTYTVNAGGDFQAALNAAQPGDTIVLQAGATFTGNFVLPANASSSTTYITIRSSAPDSALPPAGTRIDPTYSAALPKLQSPNSWPALATVAGTHHYQLVALEFLANNQGYGDVIDLGDGSSAQNTLALVPHDFVLDRLYIHGDVTYGQKRGIGLNSASTTIENSYVAEIKANGQDSQAICGWNGPGPYTITNNYLEAAGENVLFGGADPSIPNLVPSDITFRNNYLSKQTIWQVQTQWSVKNLFELKNAQRVVVDGNVMEYNWVASQPGYSVVFTPRNQNGTAPWTVVQDVRFTNNVVRHVSSAINILGNDNENPSQLTNGLTISNNLFVDVSSATYGGAGRFILVNGGANITVDHNTVFEDGNSVVYATGPAVTGWVFTNNIAPNNNWAIMGDNASPGNNTVATYFPQSQWLDGIFTNTNPSVYPVGNYYPASMSAVGFVDLTGGNYRLAATSIYRNAATDGTDVGCNIDALNAAAGTKY